MFTGIIEQTGIILSIQSNGTNKTFQVKSGISSQLSIDQSLSHDGVCLTVEAVNKDVHTVTAIEETLVKTNLNSWKQGNIINLERCMQMNGRLDGHIVQGHVDTTALCINIEDKNGSWEFSFEVNKQYAPLIIEKGSISINGISLTIFNVTEKSFTVGIIPYTYEHSNLHQLSKGEKVNLEFDIIGKYVNRIISLKS